MLGESMKTPYLKFEKLCTLTNAAEKLVGCVSTDRNFLMTDADLPPSFPMGNMQYRRKVVEKESVKLITFRELNSWLLAYEARTQPLCNNPSVGTLMVYFFISPWLYWSAPIGELIKLFQHNSTRPVLWVVSTSTKIDQETSGLCDS